MRPALIKQIITALLFAVISTVAIIFVSRNVDVTDMKPQPEETEPTVETTAQKVEVTETAEDETTEDEPEVVPFPSDYILDESPECDDGYLEKFIFLGDKNTYMMGRYSYTGVPDPIRQVWSVEENVSPMRITSINNFIYPATSESTNYLSAINERCPVFLVLSFGSFDDGENMTKERLITSYGNFIVNAKFASPNTQIIVQSILPVSKDCEIVKTQQIKERNSWLIELCHTYKIYYADVYSTLCDEDGTLLSEYETDGGYYLNEKGYSKVIDYYKNHVHPQYTIK